MWVCGNCGAKHEQQVETPRPFPARIGPFRHQRMRTAKRIDQASKTG